MNGHCQTLVNGLKKSARSSGLVVPQQHPVYHLGLAQDQPWVRRIYLQLEPKPADEHAEVLVFAAVLGTPDIGPPQRVAAS